MADPTRKKYSIGELFCCNHCGVEVIATETLIKGHKYICKKCRNAATLKYQVNNKEKVKGWNKKYLDSEPGKIMRQNSTRKYRRANPEKQKAHWTVAHAKKNGIIKSQPCEKCGKENTHAHHEDYSKPLEVRWLCPGCHKKEHQLLSQLQSKP